MKKFYTTLLATAMMFGLATTATAETYQAWGSVLFAYTQTPMYDDGETLEVTDETIKFTSATWGTGTFDAATGEGTLTMDNHRGGTSDYPADIKGSVAGNDFVITVPSVMGGTVITITIGTMPAACATAGTYKGGIYANAAYFKQYQPEQDQSVKITANDDLETVSVSFSNSTWGTFTYPSVAIATGEDGAYTLSGEGNCAMPSMRDPSVVTDYASTLTGTITAEGTLVAEFAIPGVMGGTTVLFNPADFDEVFAASAIKTAAAGLQDEDTPAYNLSGVRVGASYKGIVIRNGKKFLQK